jgi:predicted DNA-binding transcriptional regulator AlpA
MNSRVLYTIQEARHLLGGMSRNSIYLLLRNGQLPSVVIGCRRFIAHTAIVELVEKSTARLRKPDQNYLPLPFPATNRKRRKDGEPE